MPGGWPWDFWTINSSTMFFWEWRSSLWGFKEKGPLDFFLNSGWGPYTEATNSFLGGNSNILFHFYPDVWGDDAIFRSIFKLGWHKPPSRFGFIIPAILRIPSLTNQFFIKHFFRSNGSLMIGGSILRKTPRAHQGFHGFQAFTFHQMTWGFWVMLHFLGLIWGFPKMVVPNNHGFSYQKWS